MKTTTTPNQINAIIAALKTLHVSTFRCESCDPKYNAQRNLRGKTHYVDDDTLKFHKSRICGTAILHGGLLFRLTGSDALDMNNTKRGFRSVVFDVFGTTVYRPDLEHAKRSSDSAIEDAQAREIDLLAHYRDAIREQLERKQRECGEIESALEIMDCEPVAA